MVLSTTSYAAGGFDPMLTVWNEFGTWYGANDDASAARDSYLDLVLPLGNYIVALTQFENYPNGAPSDGFTHDGEPWFTSQLWGNGQPGGFFDVAGNQRSSLWTMEVMGANVAPVPEPTTYLAGLLMLIPFGTAIVRTMRRQPQS